MDSTLADIMIPNNNFFADRNGLQPRWIICHGTAGGTNAEAIAYYFQESQAGSSPVSSHYVIGQDGTIVQTVAENDGSWANGVITPGHNTWWIPQVNPNNVTITIEHCKLSSDNSDALTARQKTASFELIRDICRRWNIPMRAADPDGGITGHFSIDPVNRSRCPGAYPWEELWAFLKEETMSGYGVPRGWSDNGKTLTAPNGKKVVHGFRNFIFDQFWDPANMPLEEEHGANPVQLHRQDLGGGTRQCFRDGVLWWTSQKGVIYEKQLGFELFEAYARMNTTGDGKVIADLRSIATIADKYK